MRGKRVIALGMVAVFLLVGCSSGEETKETTKVTTKTDVTVAVEDAQPERIKLSILNRQWDNFPPDVDPNDNPIANIFDEKLPNIDIEWTLVPKSSLEEKANMLVATGDYPDVIPVTIDTMVRWADMGVIQPLDDYIDGYDQIYNYLEEDDMKRVYYNGHIWGIISPNNSLNNPRMLYMRKDWLENLGLDEPKTIEELYDVLYAFTYEDPDGNGKDDTYGIAGMKDFYNLEPIFRAFDVSHNYAESKPWWTWIDGEAIPDFVRPEMKDALVFLNRLYEDGIMDKDTLVINQTQMVEKFVQGTIGMVVSQQLNMCSNLIYNLQESTPEADILTWTPEVEGNKNKVGLTASGLPQVHVVSSKCENPEAVIELANWLITPNEEMEPYFQLNSDEIYFAGVGEGVVPLGEKYLTEANVVDMTPELVTERNIRLSYRWHNSTIHAMTDEDVIASAKAQVEAGQMYPSYYTDKIFISENKICTADQITGTTYNELFGDIETYWMEVMAGIIIGELPIDALDEFKEFFYDNGGQDIIDEITEMN